MIKKMILLCLVLQLLPTKNELKSQTIPETNRLILSGKNIETDTTQKSWQKDRSRKNRISAGVGFFANGDNTVGITIDYLRDIKKGFYADFGMGLYSLAYEAEVKGYYDVLYSNNLIGILPGAGVAFTGFNSDGLNLNPLLLLKIDLHISDLNSLGVEYKGVLAPDNDGTKLGSFLSVNLGFKF